MSKMDADLVKSLMKTEETESVIQSEILYCGLLEKGAN